MNVIGFAKDGNSIIVDVGGVEYFVPKDADGNSYRVMIAEWEADGNTIPPYVEPEPPTLTLNDYRSAIQAMIEETAQSKQYDSAVNLTSYVASTNPVWAAQAQAFVAWRDSVWIYAYAELEKVQNGEREQPSIEAIIEELPKITWPST